MQILSVGSVALDAVETPAGSVDGVIGGSAVFFSAAASLLAPVRVVGVVGDDYPLARLRFLRDRGVDFAGLERLPGESFFWGGRYSDDFRSRETTVTRLGVFADFDPVVPAAYRDSKIVFLGNIDPELQLGVLDQVRSPELVAADTMNYWIERTPDALKRVLARLDVLLVNDEEAYQLAGCDDLPTAARWIRRHGPTLVMVKRGEDGAVLFTDDWTFSCPSYPVARITDPTGAGDAFAGGFLGHLARAGSRDRAALREATTYGAATGSCAVEAFSVDRFRTLSLPELDDRVRALEATVAAEPQLAATRQ
ncbi:MAG: sugar kinase [Gemmatimonadetes bacterium]|nr:sugar kinase [Gemmatimonadota bacterium]MYB98251.1 sugar kinase [Gemmatimonadota bacterium]MYI45860.1 sugar kinase [Gemmatimonadota bacterium]